MLKYAALLLMLFIAGCSGGNSGSAQNSGSATARLVWPQTPKSAGKTVRSAPADVATVRFIVSATDIAPPLMQDFPAAGGSGTMTGIPAGANRTFTFQGLTAAGSVAYQGAINGVTITAGSNYDLGNIGMTVVVVRAPAAPTGLTAKAAGATVTLAWAAADQLATGFVVQRSADGGATWTQIATPGAGVTTYKYPGLANGTTYQYRIQAANGAGASAASATAGATTLISLPRTGQTANQAAGDDGDLKKGVAWPNPRFTDNSDGTVTDNLTGLVWLKNANCFGPTYWADALDKANRLSSSACGLTDGSGAGDWRLPNRTELMSLIDWSQPSSGGSDRALPVGYNSFFTGVQSYYYWSSSAWFVYMYVGFVVYGSKGNGYYVWPVRAGQ